MTYFEKHVKESILVDEKVTIGSIMGLVDKLVDRFEYNPNVEVENLKIYFENDDDFKRKKSEYPSGTWKLCINLQVRGKPCVIYVGGEKDRLYCLNTQSKSKYIIYGKLNRLMAPDKDKDIGFYVFNNLY